MDAFATEIGGEIYYHPEGGVIAMVGVTNGALNPTVVESTKIDSVTKEINVYSPAFHGKLGYDSQYKNDFRFRITGSYTQCKARQAAPYLQVTERLALFLCIGKHRCHCLMAISGPEGSRLHSATR
jgi:hypothetical protein